MAHDVTTIPFTAGKASASPFTLDFAAGRTTRVVKMAVRGDLVAEPEETFSLELSAPVGATISDASGVGTITDND